jgi:hypothetical protein
MPHFKCASEDQDLKVEKVRVEMSGAAVGSFSGSRKFFQDETTKNTFHFSKVGYNLPK